MFESLRVFASRIRAIFLRRREDAEFSAEIGSHLELLTEEFVRRGMTPADARFAALRKLGRPTEIAESNRELRGLPVLETLLHDLRYSVRTLRRSPGFSAVVILIFALGIGGCSALFSVASRTVVSGLRFPGAKNIVAVWRERVGRGPGQGLLSPAEYLAYRQSAESLESFSALEPVTAIRTGDENPVPVPAARVTAETFHTLGIEPRLGRTFTESDSEGSSQRVALISESYWQTHFGSDPAILGETMDLQLSSMNRDVDAASGTFSIVGVLPAALPFDGLGPLNADIWIPLPASGMAANRTLFDFFALGRLRRGAKVRTAEAELSAAAAELSRQFPQTNASWGVRAVPLDEQVYGDLQGSLLMLGAAIALVLLIACANVAHLEYARATAREKEFALRSALGASRARQIRQIVTESAVLALIGGACGVVLENGASGCSLRAARFRACRNRVCISMPGRR